MTTALTLPCRPVHLRAPGWLALHAAALWPHVAWAAQRLADGSDDPLGLAALAALLLWLACHHASLRALPRRPWLIAAAALTLAATGAHAAGAPPLASALLAAFALALHLAAWLPPRAPRAALGGLLLLALPLVASLQFYAGYPLRVLTAQGSAWLLQAAGLVAERSGAALTVSGRLVLVDAPCSGVQMAWCGWFAACAAAAFAGRADAAWLRRLPMVGAVVLAGNVLRNTVLVALEARPGGLAPALHEAIGIAVLAAVLLAVLKLVLPGRPA